jgi:hypothetical protein
MKYDDHVKRSLFTELCEFPVKDRTLTQRQYTGLDISDAFCPYWIEVYPSDELLSAHTSSDPIVFTVIAVGARCSSEVNERHVDFWSHKN